MALNTTVGRRAAAAALEAGLVMCWAWPGGAQAQSDAPGTTLDRVTVTGSNLRRSERETAAPVQVISSADIERSGLTSISDVLRSIPADNSGSLSQAFSIGFAAGASGLSLRGLSVNATLVLLDGHRLAPYPLADDGQRSFADLSAIPLAMVERIEVLKDGASAIYGSDAIAGVVNIILKKEFRGADGTAIVGTSYRGDGTTAYAQASYGIGSLSGDGHNTYFNVEYRHQDAILQRTRGSYLGNQDLRDRGGPDMRGGIIQPGNVAPSNFAQTLVGMVAPLAPDRTQSGPFQLLPGCAAANLNYSGGCTWDPLQYTEVQPATRNLNLLARTTLRLGERWSVTLDGSLFESRSEQVNSTTYLPQGGQTDPTTSPVILPANHPDNPFGPTNAALLYYTFGDVGPRRFATDTHTLRTVASAKGGVGDWGIDASVGYSRSVTDLTYRGNVRTSALASLLANGSYRIGANAGLNSPGIYAQLAPVTTATATSSLAFVTAAASTEFGALPGGPLAAVFGVEARHVQIDNPGQPYAAEGDLQGTFTAFAKGSQSAYAAFTEVDAPILKNLEVNLAARYERHPSIGESTVPKLGVKWSPLQVLTLRGTYSKGFRVPGVAESGQSALNAFTNYNNPARCPTTNLPSDCNALIVLALAANPRLEPETSESSTLGLIFEPTPTTNVSIDYYRIRRRNEIALAPYASAIPIFGGPDLGNPGLPPPIVGLSLPYVNANASRTSGVDVDLRQRVDLGDLGRFTADLQATYMFGFRENIGGTVYDFAGTHGPTSLSGNVGTPRTRATLGLAWERGPATFSTNINYVASISGKDPSQGNACLMLEAAPSCRIASFTTVDAFAGYRWTRQFKLTFNVRNIANRLPPLDTVTYGGINYNPSLHQAGAIGRYFEIGAHYEF